MSIKNLIKSYLYKFTIFLVFLVGTSLASFILNFIFILFYDRVIEEILSHHQAVIILIVVENALKILPIFLSIILTYFIPKFKVALIFMLVTFLIIAVITSFYTRII